MKTSKPWIKEWNQNRAFYISSIFACIFILSLVLASLNREIRESPMIVLLQLGRAYQTRGIEGFLAEKRKLKKVIHATLMDRDSEMQKAAINIAVYLFPELLPDKDLERGVASDLWVPHELLIEKMPGTRQSREAFERMRANIWNYENPNQASPQLSMPAKQILNIYETLTSP